MNRSLVLVGVVAALALGSSRDARANNSPENAQRRAQEDIVPKIDLLCGTHLTVHYDGESLRKHNKDIAQDTTGGGNECDEPLRLVWYACKTDQGKRAVNAARIEKVECRGTGNQKGSLTVANGVITVERSLHEIEAPEPNDRMFDVFPKEKPPGMLEKQYTRSHREFEKAMKLSLALASEDPYYDEAWRDVAQQKNPVTSTTDYCLVNGKKLAPDDNDAMPDNFVRRKEDATVRCWQKGQMITDLVIKGGRRTGLHTESVTNGTRRSIYRDDKLQGEQLVTENGKPKWITFYDHGDDLWHKDFHPSGKLDRYRRRVTGGQAEIHLGEDGRVYGLHCSPDVKDDKELRTWCGFERTSTVSIYDGTGKVSHVQTWKNGVLQKEDAGNSSYASGSTVSYKDGKKHGEERIVGKDGKLHLTVEWHFGVQDGREREYAEDGKKVVKETLWKAGEVREVTELFLNGNPKSREVWEGKDRKQAKRYWDTGKVRNEGAYVTCHGEWRRNDWCPDGTHKTYYENGGNETTQSFVSGKREGTTKSWWPDGKPAATESWANDKLTKAKRWDQDGKLVLDEEYEADGSRKVKR